MGKVYENSVDCVYSDPDLFEDCDTLDDVIQRVNPLVFDRLSDRVGILDKTSSTEWESSHEEFEKYVLGTWKTYLHFWEDIQ